MRRSTTSPFLINTKVGMAETEYLAAVSLLSSTSILTKTTSGVLLDRSEKKGAICLQGPHHSALKSITTNLLSAPAFNRIDSTSASVDGSWTASSDPPPRGGVVVATAAAAFAHPLLNPNVLGQAAVPAVVAVVVFDVGCVAGDDDSADAPTTVAITATTNRRFFMVNGECKRQKWYVSDSYGS